MSLDDISLCKLSISGIMHRDPIRFKTKTGKLICLFTVCYVTTKGSGRNILFHFVAFKNICEYILANYKKGDNMRVKEAYGLEANDRPSRIDPDTIILRDVWKVRSIQVVGGEIINQEAYAEELPY